MLKEISIPASVTSIGKRAFYFYGTEGGLEVINLYGETPPTIYSGSGYPTFSMWDTIYVRVPCGKTSVYQSAPVWNNYSNFIYEECVGLEDYPQAVMNLYPNPATQYVVLDMSTGEEMDGSVMVTDMLGRRCLQQKAIGTSVRIPVIGLPTGMYFLTYTDGKRTVTRKFMKE
jgi:hypothetical protein